MYKVGKVNIIGNIMKVTIIFIFTISFIIGIMSIVKNRFKKFTFLNLFIVNKSLV